MNLTLQDVLSHHAFKRIVMSKTQAEIEDMRNIGLVLEKYDKVLEMYSSYNLTEIDSNTRKKGFTHFQECPWSNGVEGPDTCACCYVSRYCREIINILDERFSFDE